MLKDLECIYCNTKFQVERCANFTVICPCCKRSIYLECEYGYGPVSPCRIYVGETIVGIVESSKTNYYLEINHKRIYLLKTYLEAIYEAEEAVKKYLNISRHNENVEILTKEGSLYFYGDWFGRPYDNYHKIIHVCYDGEILEIIFDRRERLLIYEPENIISSIQELKIEKARKLKWIYIPYNSVKREYDTISYIAECEGISKETKYGTEHLAVKEPSIAVYMG